MTKCKERISIAAAALGAVCVLAAAAWGLPGPIALAFTGVVLLLLGVGVRQIAGVAMDGVAGFEELSNGEKPEI